MWFFCSYFFSVFFRSSLDDADAIDDDDNSNQPTLIHIHSLMDFYFGKSRSFNDLESSGMDRERDSSEEAEALLEIPDVRARERIPL